MGYIVKSRTAKAKNVSPPHKKAVRLQCLCSLHPSDQRIKGKRGDITSKI